MSWRDAIGVLEDVLPQDMMSEEIIWCNRSDWSYDDYRAMKRLGVDPRDYESPIAAFEAVLLCDEVVESAAIEIHAEGWNGGKEWADVHPVEQDNYKQQARAALQAALAAAKGMEGEG